MSDATAIDNGDADQLDQSLDELNLETQKHSGQANRDIERVTDYAEEAQVDADKLTAVLLFAVCAHVDLLQAMNLLTGPNKSSAAKYFLLERRLTRCSEANAVKISKDDVEVIVRHDKFM